jgi:hypothetical protein
LPKALQDPGWQAQVRLCKRYRRLVARGKHPHIVVTAIARELIDFVGHRPRHADARVTRQGRGGTATTDTGVALDDVKRRLRSALVPND